MKDLQGVKRGWSLAVAAGLLSVAGCQTVPLRGGAEALEADGGSAPGVGAVVSALRPVSLVVHPLTRLERDERGRARLTVQFELRDASGDSVKWLGVARVEASPAGGGGEPVGVVESLTTAEACASRFDWMTRTFALRCGGELPGWLTGEGSRAEAWRVRVWFTYKGEDGEPVTLTGELVRPALRGTSPSRGDGP